MLDSEDLCGGRLKVRRMYGCEWLTGLGEREARGVEQHEKEGKQKENGVVLHF